MVHLTNQMVQKSPIPNIDQVLKSNPEIARQLATAAMQTQSRAPMQAQAQAQAPSNPLGGLANFMSSMMPPQRPQTIKSPVKLAPRPNPQPAAAAIPPIREMKPPSVPSDISDLLKSVGVQEKKVVMNPAKRGGSTGKNSVSIKL